MCKSLQKTGRSVKSGRVLGCHGRPCRSSRSAVSGKVAHLRDRRFGAMSTIEPPRPWGSHAVASARSEVKSHALGRDALVASGSCMSLHPPRHGPARTVPAPPSARGVGAGCRRGRPPRPPRRPWRTRAPTLVGARVPRARPASRTGSGCRTFRAGGGPPRTSAPTIDSDRRTDHRSDRRTDHRSDRRTDQRSDRRTIALCAA